LGERLPAAANNHSEFFDKRLKKIRTLQQAGASATPSAGSAPAVEGKLSIADHVSQIGVIANRTIKENGRVVKIIYYRLADPIARPPYKESDLVQAGVKTFKYDAAGSRLARVGQAS